MVRKIAGVRNCCIPELLALKWLIITVKIFDFFLNFCLILQVISEKLGPVMSEEDIFSLVSNAKEFDKDEDAESTTLRLRDITGRERMAFGELCRHLFQKSLPRATRWRLELTA